MSTTRREPNKDLVPKYFFEDGLRKVKPYTYVYETFAKQRWHGRSLLDVFRIDFRDRSAAYYEHAIKIGSIRLNDNITSPDTKLKNGDRITNTVHRHEPPVTGDTVRIVHRDDANGILVVEKPGSMPVHVTGRYRFNTLIEVLCHDNDIKRVYTQNRLDRLTSGIMVCTTTVPAAQKLGELFNSEDGVKKEYVCRVSGRFPVDETVCEARLLPVDRQLGVNIVHPKGKHAKTIFKRLSYHEGSDTSVVHCRPFTGRTHQIRVHLQYLGFPIANDPFYNNAVAWGKSKAQFGLYRDEAESDGPAPHRGGREEPSEANMDTGVAITFTPELRTALTELRRTKDADDDFARLKDNPNRLTDDEHSTAYCDTCGIPLLPDPKPNQLCIWLHAMRYYSERGGWDYTSDPLPTWADSEWPNWQQAMAEIDVH